mmetsp:Transcript_3043/g.7591  ORF Transcript_3043/g.7591 Transcript_3043/m.7591 type:complete len:571 (-) Transcript_3043:541-2253(-)
MSMVTGLRFATLTEEEPLAWDKAVDGAIAFSKSATGADVLSCTGTSGTMVLQTAVTQRTMWRATSTTFMVNPHSSTHNSTSCLVIKCPSKQSADGIQASLDAILAAQQQQQPHQHAGHASNGVPAAGHAGQQAQPTKAGPSGNVVIPPGSGTGNVFDKKTDKGSSDMYFKYYASLQNQQNMLQDYTRTGMYFMAITENRADFEGKVVMDVGAGSGILSLFAAMAGARKVYAVEASGMARFARRLADGNPSLGSRIEVINSKVEEVTLSEKVDVLVSEPMGTLLVNERMLETYLYARDAFLKPGGKMFPQLGRIHAAAFSDEVLHAEVATKAVFWTQNNFYGVDVTPLYPSAVDSYFGQVVVDAFDHTVLASSCATKVFDFGSCPEASLHDIQLPLQLQVTSSGPCTIHGLACWFDVFFHGSQTPVWLSTAPGLPTTHWFQLRCVLKAPIVVAGPGAVLTGSLRLVAHRHQSYDVHVTLTGPPLVPGGPPQTASGIFDLKEPYYRQLTTGWWQQMAGAAAAATPGDQAQQQGAGHAPAGQAQQQQQQAGGAGAGMMQGGFQQAMGAGAWRG